MGRKVVQHRIFDLSVTLIIVVTLSTLRSVFMPVGDEAIVNTPTPVGILLQNMQSNMPMLSAVVWWVSLLFAGFSVGRYAAKYSIYPAYTLMAIPVFAVLASAVIVSGDYLVSSVALLLMLLASKYIHRCVMRTKSFNDVSLAMLSFGMLPLVFAPAAILYVALPFLILSLYHSWRNLLVALGSLALPLFAVCYWEWCAGEEFLAPARLIYSSMLGESEFKLFATLNPASILLLGVVILMVLCGVSLIISDRYSLKTNSRSVMLFNALVMFVVVGMFFLPSSTATTFAILAVPVAMLVPLVFVRMGTGFTETLYRLMLLAAVANMVAMCWM